jgi:hypothetical protein
METKELCKLCGENLYNNQSDALYYCIKCTEDINKGTGLFQ